MDVITLDDPRDFVKYRTGSGGTVEIFDIAVGTERGIGRGRALIAKLLSQIDASTLVFALTRGSNTPAHAFYMKVGFRCLGLLTRFYPDTGEDAVMFGLDVE